MDEGLTRLKRHLLGSPDYTDGWDELSRVVFRTQAETDPLFLSQALALLRQDKDRRWINDFIFSLYGLTPHDSPPIPAPFWVNSSQLRETQGRFYDFITGLDVFGKLGDHIMYLVPPAILENGYAPIDHLFREECPIKRFPSYLSPLITQEQFVQFARRTDHVPSAETLGHLGGDKFLDATWRDASAYAACFRGTLPSYISLEIAAADFRVSTATRFGVPILGDNSELVLGRNSSDRRRHIFFTEHFSPVAGIQYRGIPLNQNGIVATSRIEVAIPAVQVPITQLVEV